MSEPTVCCVKRHDPTAPMQCFSCKEFKDAACFYLVKGKRKGPCKACKLIYQRQYVSANPEKRRAIWRRHAENNREAYRQANCEYYARNRDDRLQAQRDRRLADNRVKTNARALLAVYVKTGKIVRKPCEKCGSTIRIHGHHHDYTKPLDVVWLCSLCHGKEHRRVA